MMYRKLFFSLLTLALLVIATGCDSNDDDDASDAEVFVGNWAVVSLSDDTGDQTAAFQTIVDGFTADFDANGTYDLSLDYNAQGEALGRTDIAFSDTYVVNESANTVRLNTPLGASLELDYTIDSNDRITLSGPALVVNLAFGTNYTGTARLVIQRL